MNRREFVKLAPAFPAAAVTATLTLREDGKEPLELDVSVLKVQPGDMLVLSCSQPMSMDTHERIRSMVESFFVDRGVKAMVLADGITIEGVLRA